MKKLTTFVVTAILIVTTIACQKAPEKPQTPESPSTSELKPLVEKVLSAEEQAALTPDAVYE